MRCAFAPLPIEQRIRGYQVDHLPKPSRLADLPPWDDGFEAELRYSVQIAHRSIVDNQIGLQQVSSWLILALARRVATLESSNQALRQMRQPAEGA